MVDLAQLKQDLDWKAIAILDELRENGNQANTTQLKHATGWNSSVIHYRYDKLVDAGLVTKRKGHTDTDRIPPTVATLTERGEQAIDDGLIDSFNLDQLTVRDLKEKTEQHDHRFSRLETQLSERNSHYDARIADLETRLESIEDALEEIANQSTIDKLLNR
jgi:DNA-binding MarR family transcriptional regulator